MEIAILDTFLQKIGLLKTEEIRISISQEQLLQGFNQILHEMEKDIWGKPQLRYGLSIISKNKEEISFLQKLNWEGVKGVKHYILRLKHQSRADNKSILSVYARVKYPHAFFLFVLFILGALSILMIPISIGPFLCSLLFNIMFYLTARQRLNKSLIQFIQLLQEIEQNTHRK